MPRHDVPSRSEGRPARGGPHHERWRDEHPHELDEEEEEKNAAPRIRPDAGPPVEEEQPQSPGAEPLHKTQQQQH